MSSQMKFSAFLVIFFLLNLSPLLGKDTQETNVSQQQTPLKISPSPQPQTPQSTSKGTNIKENGHIFKDTNKGVVSTAPAEGFTLIPSLISPTPLMIPKVTEVNTATKTDTTKNISDTLKMRQALQTSEGETFIAIGKGKVAPFLQHIVNRGKLIVAMYAVDQPPFFMKDKDGKLIGLDVEIATKMAEILGVDVEFNREAQSFNEVVDIVSTGKADVGISKLSFTLVRCQKVLYTKPYIVLGKTFLINRLEMAKLNITKKADTLNGLFNQMGRTIGVIKDSSYESFARQLFPKAQITTLDSWGPHTLELAVEGKILGVFRDDLEIKKLIRQKPDANLKVLPVTLKNQEDPIRIIVPWNQDHFVFWVNEFLQTMEISFTVDELLTKYSSYFQQMMEDTTKTEKGTASKLENSTSQENKPEKTDTKPQEAAPSPEKPKSTEKRT